MAAIAPLILDTAAEIWEHMVRPPLIHVTLGHTARMLVMVAVLALWAVVVARGQLEEERQHTEVRPVTTTTGCRGCLHPRVTEVTEWAAVIGRLHETHSVGSVIDAHWSGGGMGDGHGHVSSYDKYDKYDSYDKYSRRY
ncbi:unnamed protein product [Gongylonema pulchrum]|uniref:Uncharacterized protein n=1 Tax=Gongylonema pulchrum TaxID=637853 RepID=A0A183D2B7_9BILA|nr:unnamed protein product [Gongylonema pulchrum]